MVKKRCRIITVFDASNQNRDDKFQYNYCKLNDYFLVTLDDDFWNDKAYPIMKLPGILILDISNNKIEGIFNLLIKFFDFMFSFPYPKYFTGDSKFKLSQNKFIMKGRDSMTRKIKTFQIKEGDSVEYICKKL